jgi:hypothetical protein
MVLICSPISQLLGRCGSWQVSGIALRSTPDTILIDIKQTERDLRTISSETQYRMMEQSEGEGDPVTQD